MELLTEVKRGEEASRIIDNPLFIEAKDKVRAGILKAMGESPMGDEKTHNRLVIALQLLDQIEKNLNNVMQTGKLAAIQMREKESISEKVRKSFRPR